MELWKWGLAVLGGGSAVFVCGAITWGMFDVLKDRRLDPVTRTGWLLVLAFLPLFGIAAWLYAKSKLSPSF